MSSDPVAICRRFGATVHNVHVLSDVSVLMMSGGVDYVSLGTLYDDAQNEFQQAEQDVVNRIGTKMLAVLEKYAKDNGYTVILDVSNPQTPVLWASQGTIITKDLVDAYNIANPSAAPPTKASGAGATAPRATVPRPATTPAATPKKPQ